MRNRRIVADTLSGKGERMADRENVIKGLSELEDFLFSEYRKVSADESKAWYERFVVVNNALELLKEQEWIPISERLPENAEHPGAFCPKVRVLTVWGESYGWYNPDVKAWYFLEWYMDSSRNHLDFERGDYPGISYTPRNTNLITHWKPIP